jgi:hypothetical protein
MMHNKRHCSGVVRLPTADIPYTVEAGQSTLWSGSGMALPWAMAQLPAIGDVLLLDMKWHFFADSQW